MFSALIAPIKAASFLKEGYIVSCCADVSQYTERYESTLEKRNSKLHSVYSVVSLKYKNWKGSTVGMQSGYHYCTVKTKYHETFTIPIKY